MPSMNPYDIYEAEPSRHRFIDLGGMASSTAVIGADIAAQMLIIPALTNYKRMRNLMRLPGGDTSRLHAFSRMTVAKYGSGGAHNLSSMARTVGPKDIGLGRGMLRGSSFERSVQFGEHLTSQFGKAAATRMQLAKGLTGISRFMMGYMMVDLGITMGRSLVDFVQSYERPSRQLNSRTLETGGLFVDTRSAQTQRQRAISAIHNSQLSTRACMGSEASMLHLER